MSTQNQGPMMPDGNRELEIRTIAAWLERDNESAIREYHLKLANYEQTWGGYPEHLRRGKKPEPPMIKKLNVDLFRKFWEEGGNNGSMLGMDDLTRRGVITSEEYQPPTVSGGITPAVIAAWQRGQSAPVVLAPQITVSIGEPIPNAPGLYAVGFGDNAPAGHQHQAFPGAPKLVKRAHRATPFDPEYAWYEKVS